MILEGAPSLVRLLIILPSDFWIARQACLIVNAIPLGELGWTVVSNSVRLGARRHFLRDD